MKDFKLNSQVETVLVVLVLRLLEVVAILIMAHILYPFWETGAMVGIIIIYGTIIMVNMIIYYFTHTLKFQYLSVKIVAMQGVILLVLFAKWWYCLKRGSFELSAMARGLVLTCILIYVVLDAKNVGDCETKCLNDNTKTSKS